MKTPAKLVLLPFSLLAATAFGAEAPARRPIELEDLHRLETLAEPEVSPGLAADRLSAQRRGPLSLSRHGRAGGGRSRLGRGAEPSAAWLCSKRVAARGWCGSSSREERYRHERWGRFLCGQPTTGCRARRSGAIAWSGIWRGTGGFWRRTGQLRSQAPDPEAPGTTGDAQETSGLRTFNPGNRLKSRSAVHSSSTPW